MTFYTGRTNSTLFKKHYNRGLGLWYFNVNFNKISVISWRSVLLVEETGLPGENHRLATGR